jgi:HEAT repeat protein
MPARAWYQKAGDKKAKKALAKLSQVKAITRRLGDEDDEVRRPAVQELARGWKKDPDTLSSLKERAISDSKGDVRQAAIQELAHGWKEDTLPWLKERTASDENSDVCQAAIQELGSF